MNSSMIFELSTVISLVALAFSIISFVRSSRNTSLDRKIQFEQVRGELRTSLTEYLRGSSTKGRHLRASELNRFGMIRFWNEAMKSMGKTINAGETPALRSGWHERGYLPHLKAEGGTYFVTFRLANSLPKEVLERFRFEREDIVKRAEAAGRELSPDEEKRLDELYSARIESYLDAGHGKCWLEEPVIGEMVSEALMHFDGERYWLHAWVVMPNHVHAVVTPQKSHTLSQILQSWKSFTAHEAQKVAQASRLQIPEGKAFWQRESYDHLVRDEADFARVCEYTARNPVEAGLCRKPEEWPYVGVAQASPPASQ